MTDLVNVARALADESRVRALLALRGGELCLCQIIELLGLAPSTVSKHMDVLFRAGLVERRKEGRWHYFQLAGRPAPLYPGLDVRPTPGERLAGLRDAAEEVLFRTVGNLRYPSPSPVTTVLAAPSPARDVVESTDPQPRASSLTRDAETVESDHARAPASTTPKG